MPSLPADTRRRFVVRPCGDPFNRRGVVVTEYTRFGDRFGVYRGDLSPIRGRRTAVAALRRLYPDCRIRFAGF